ncbi:HYR domain-containing protein [Neolewinella aurantiaca]|uniref:HYR domain-containing protein n=1 Tax=Neolewinella aurantiaca TaxID=2602767 RepID=A0A5C7FHZ7_9BACT|nr:HYR domain-containing protein [Neolewinella aurantiaca]TXF90121.1 HYR domain-containing protein [Neolewinella aurantiaca]
MLLSRLYIVIVFLLWLPQLAAQETACGDGIDNDGDGLIDCYDGDCSGVAGCEDFFFGQPVPDCGFTPPELEEIELNLLYQTDEMLYPIDQRSGVVIGDMNGDGIPDLVSRDNNPSRLHIFSGDDGSILQSIVTPRTHPFGQVAIADVDEDGLGDAFQIEYTGVLARYEFGNPNPVWTTATNIGDDNLVSTPQIADINQDGVPEIYVGDRIFNAITGERYVDGDASVNVGGYGTGGNSDRYPIYFDLYQPGDPRPDGMGTFGPEAAGMEYIAGNQVWTVDFDPSGGMDNGSYQLAAEYSGPTNLRDGFTSIADINGDGRMDIAVMDAGDVYAWDPYTNELIGPSYQVPSTAAGGRINIGDFDGDGDVELGFAGRNIYIVRNYIDNDGDADPNNGTWVTLWQHTGLDDGSQRTGSTLFDFDGNGTVEVVYSEEENLFIYDGATGMELFRIQSRAGTRTEYPIVADVNGDGTAEIIVTAQTGNGPGASGTDWISVYESANQPWVPARQVWNQHGYNVTNINDDLTVPQFQQNNLNPALGQRYNNFLVQTSVGGGPEAVITYPAPDAIIMVEIGGDGLPVIDFSGCPDEILATLVIENAGSAPLPASTPISYYIDDPRVTMATLIQTTSLPVQVEAGDQTTVQVTIPISAVPAGAFIYLSVNDPGFAAADLPFQDSDFPLTGTPECDYSNNVNFLGNARCGEICNDGIDNDGDGFIDEPNLTQFEDTGCPGDVLQAITADVPNGVWSVVGGSAIGTTVDQNGVVTLGNNFTGAPVTETIRYDDGICVGDVMVTTLDDVPPAVQCPGDAVVAVDADCEITLADYTANAQSSDNCTATNDIVITQSPVAGSTLNIGANTVTITATDQSGNASSCTFTVTGEDRIAPTLTCPADTDVTVDQNCQYQIPDLTGDATVTDNCSMGAGITLAQTPVQGQVRSNDGTNVLVTITATDEAGNVSNCTYTLTLDDETPPTINCPGTQTRNVSSNDCSVVVPDFTGQAGVQDNCSPGNQITVTQSPAAGSMITSATTTQITLTATDQDGNSSNCTFDLITVDRTQPMITCPAPITVDADAISCAGTVTDVTGLASATDNCGAAGITITQSPAAGTTFTAATQNVTVTATDAAGNSSQCSVTFIKEDVTPPVLNCVGPQTLVVDANNCLAILPNYMNGVASDACGGVSVVQTPGPGTNISNDLTVTITATDNAGLQTSCTIDVTVVDQTPPVISCPAPQTIAVDGTCEVPLPDYASQASVSDNCDPRKGPVAVVQSPAAGTMYDINDSPVTVTLTATDASGNTANCSFQVELMDNQPPMITCPVSPQLDQLDANCQALIPDFRGATMVSSTCTMDGFTLVQSPAPNTVVSGEQVIQITITASDVNGNSISCMFDYQTEDVTPPTLTCPADQTEAVDGACSFTIPDYTGMAVIEDNCSSLAPAPAPNLTVTQSPAAGTVVTGDGTVTTITISATDAAGNSASCDFTLTLEDDTDPVITCPADQARDLNASCSYGLEDFSSLSTQTDNCSMGAAIAVTQSPTAGSLTFSAPGTQTITLTATDEAGNTANCAFVLTVSDVTPPVITCPQPVTLNVDASCMATVPDLTAAAGVTDNCTANGLPTVSQDIAAGTTLTGDGTTQNVVLTATDANGLTATCTVVITLDDVTPPSVTCPPAQDLNLEITGCEVALSDFTPQLSLSDNCEAPAALTVQQMPAAGTIVMGANTVIPVTFDVNDGNGNSASCQFSVTLKDITDPTVSCPPSSSLTLDGDCSISLPDYTGLATASDDCVMTGDITLTQSPGPGTNLTFDGDQRMVTITADDGNGNTTSCTFTVVAEDTEMPAIVCPADRDEPVSDNCDFEIPDYTGEATVMDNCSEAAAITVTQSPAEGTIIPQAQLNLPQTITLTATDAAGNVQTCSFVITPIDNTLPTIVCPATQTILLDAANCDAVLGDYTSAATVMDNCSAPIDIVVTQDIMSGTVYNGLVPPQIDVVLRAEDESGNADSCTMTVLIRDEIDPTVDCSAANQTIALDGNCNGEIPDLIPVLVTDDNCSAQALTIIQSPAAGAQYGGDGTAVDVTFTVTDASGNTVTCIATVTFEDQTPPNTVVCPVDQDLNVDDMCAVPFPDYTDGITVLDNCRAEDGIIITQSPSIDSLVTGNGTVITVTLTADDGNGNTATCTFDVTLVDESALDLTCPGGQIVIASSDNCDGVYDDYTALVVASNQCMQPAAGVRFVQNPAAGTVLLPTLLDVPQPVTISAIDLNGNVSTCTFDVTLVDTLAPVITCPPLQEDFFDEACGFVVEDYRALATIDDNCAPLSELTITQDPMPGSGFNGPAVDQNVTITAVDPSGNLSQCSFILAVRDSTPPVVTCPAPDTLLTNADCEVTIGDYIGMAVAQDNCTEQQNLVITQLPAPGTVISGHNTTEMVTISVTDGSGNTETCTFSVTAKDEIPPTILCPGDQVVNPDANCDALIPDYRASVKRSDNCTATGAITLTQRPAPGTVLSGQGDALDVTMIADDGNGNIDSCTFIVTLEDNVPPSISCPADKTIDLDADCSYDLEDLAAQAAVADNCTTTDMIIVTQNIGIGQTFTGDGTEIVVTLTADDRNGNTAQCLTTIILEDNTAPTITCPANQEIFVDDACNAMVPDYRSATVSDNCTVPEAIVVTQVLAAGTTLSGDNTSTTITLTADDGNGNTTDCSFLLVLQDNTAPTITCPPAQEIFVDGNCTTTLPDYTGLASTADNCSPAPALSQSNAPGSPLNGLSTETVTLTADDGNGNTTDCTFMVTVSDNTPPALTCPPLSVIAADPACMVTIADYRDSITVTDNCGPLSVQAGALTLVQSPVPGATISGLGAEQVVTIIATDPSGNSTQCMITVELEDVTAPTIACPADTTLVVDAACAALIPDYTSLPEVADNCEGSGAVTVTQSPAPGTMVSDEASLITITLTATDASGNAANCDFDVQLIDTIPPMITCPADDVISVDGNCQILLPDYRPNAGLADNCSEPGDIVVMTQRPLAGTPLSGDGLTLEVTLIATDESGNQDSCTMMVTLEDSTDPMITCPADQELTADGNCQQSIPDYTGEATASSACEQSNITITQMPLPGTTISGHLATETITLTATDGSGNSVSCSFEVTLFDRTPPTIPVCQNDTLGVLTAACDYTVPDYWDIGPATAQDNCRPTGTTSTSATGNQIVYTQTPPPGSVLTPPLGGGGLTITLTADDGNGNTVSCDFELTLTDTISPTITCPADTVANPDAGCDFALEDYTSRAIIADNCTDPADLEVTQSPPAGTVISGQAFSQDITLTVEDLSGNTTTCIFNLTLQDTISPSIVCPADKVENLTADCEFTVPDYTPEAVTDDNCTDPAAITVTQDPVAGTVFAAQNEGGSFTVTLTADDGNGNTTSCDFVVLLDDVIPPVITCPADSTIYVDANCEASLPDLVAVTTATDNCADVNGGSRITITQAPLATTVYSSDDTQITVTLTADDGNGNTSDCSVMVTLQDTISPMLTCPANEVLLTDGNCEVTLPDYRPQAVKSDNCTTSGNIVMTQDIAPGTVFSGEGTTQVITLTADDGNGNTSNCTLEITVDDNVPPTIVCPPTQTQFTDADCMTSIADYTGLAVTDDNCNSNLLTSGAANITVTQLPAAGTDFTGVQNVVVTLTADDGNGNTTDCQFTFFVRDNTIPQVVCPPTQQVTADVNCSAPVPDYRALVAATDNCSVLGDPNGNGIDLAQAGPTMVTGYDQEVTITITATDSSGNFSSCDFQVELIDEIDPTILCPPAQTQFADEGCDVVLDDFRGLAVGMDNCDDGTSDLTYVQTPAAGLPLNGDETMQTVTIEATDRSGNSVSCDFVVTVQDTVSPMIICPLRDTISVDGSCAVPLGDYTDQATVTDNCTASSSIVVTQSPPVDTMVMGDETEILVTLTADDGNGNTTSCMFTVELQDTIIPTIICPGRQVLMTDAACSAVIPDYRSLTDAATQCDMGVITLTQDPLENTETITGDSTIRVVTITATDDAMPPNVISCSFEVILVDDTPPVITVCPPDETIFVDEDCNIALPDFRPNLMGTDNCEAFVDMEVAQTPVPGTVFSNDDTEIVVTYTLDDTNGNSVSCTATVTLQDTISPMITCPTDQVIFTDGSCEAALPDYTNAAVSDNCTGQAALITTQVNPPGTLLSGFNDTETVTLTVDDGNGQTTSCSFVVTLDDDDDPEIVCPPSQEIDLGTDCQFVLPDYRSLALLDDNCAMNLLTVVQSPSPDSIISDLNTVTEVILTVTDASGNSANCRFTSTTVSPTPPPAQNTVMLAVNERPTGTGTVNLFDAFDNMAVSNLSNIDLDGMLDPDSDPFIVSFYLSMEDAAAETGAIPAEDYDPSIRGEVVIVRIEDPATGCFTLSQILLEPRTPGTSNAADAVQCNRPGTSVKIDGLPVPGGMGTIIAIHQWRIVSPGTTRITDANLMQADEQVLMVNTSGLRSGTIIFEYQFFEDYGDGALVPSVPKLVELELQNVGSGEFFWDGN